jgi:phosphoribosylaminoimidazole-succinocarboxamide synthase
MTLTDTTFTFEGQIGHYKGKVRDVYSLENGMLVMVASDRISAFDVVLPKGIPYKGQVLNQTAVHFLKATRDIVPNWFVDSPDPVVSIGTKAYPFKVEMVIRGHLSGHAWREYKLGKRMLCGVIMPEGLKENDAFPEPIITPTTKADLGLHDEDISREQILEKGIVSLSDYLQLEEYTRSLFKRGQQMAAERGLILVDTKYEFGKNSEGEILLIDEVHTPDSSRYFYKDGFEQRQLRGEKQLQLSKEFVREWLIENGFQGKEGQVVPEMTESIVDSISQRYIELYEQITGLKFDPSNDKPETRIQSNVDVYLNHYTNK